MDDITIARAGKALLGAVAGPARIILLDSPPGSDLRFVVVTDVGDSFAESARLDRILGKLLIPADVAVVTREEADRSQAPGSLLHEASTRGRIIAES